ncbi:hypothetical protein Tco_1518826 [Tanacetum coccineum]
MVDRWLTTIDWWLTTIDRRLPPLTGGLVVAPIMAGKPRGTTHVVTRGLLMIRCQVAGTRYCSSEVAIRGGRECQVAVRGGDEWPIRA